MSPTTRAREPAGSLTRSGRAAESQQTSRTTDPVVRTRVGRPEAGWGAGAVEPTGDQAVDQVLTRLTEVSDLELREQLAVFDAVHTALQDRLADAEG